MEKPNYILNRNPQYWCGCCGIADGGIIYLLNLL